MCTVYTQLEENEWACSNLVAHASDDGSVPVRSEAGDWLQCKGARWSNERDDIGFEMHVGSQTRSDVPGARRVTATDFG